MELIRSALNGDSESIIMLAAIYVFVVCGYSVILQSHMRTWPATVGKLRFAGIKKFGANSAHLTDQEYTGDALYDYEVNGEAYTGSRVSTWVIVASHNARFILAQQIKAAEIDSSGNVVVYYHPKKTAEKHVGSPQRFWLASNDCHWRWTASLLAVESMIALLPSILFDKIGVSALF